MNEIAPHKALLALADLQNSGQNSDLQAFWESEKPKWILAAETAKNRIRSEHPGESLGALLRNIVMTAELFQSGRFDAIESKLRELDSGWLAYKTDIAIYGPGGAPKETTSPE